MDEDKKTYQQRMEAQLNEWGGKVDELLNRVESKAKTGYEKLSQDLREKQQTAGERLKDLKASSSEAWQDVKPGLEKAWRELKEAFEKAASRF